MKTLVVDAVAPEGLAYLREHGFEIDQLMKPPLATLYDRIGDYEALVTRSGTAVTPELLAHAPRLRIIGRAGAPDFDRLRPTSDMITFHVPSTDETENMMTARELATTKRGVRLVNCARGGIINEADLLAALESGQVAGAAIDVWSEEPPKG